MAAALYNQLTNTEDASSAGTDVRLGRPIHEHVLEILKNHEVTAKGLFRKQLTREMFDDADEVYLMTDIAVPAYVQKSSKVITWPIPDPKDRGLDVHEDVFRMIEEKAKPLTATHD